MAASTLTAVSLAAPSALAGDSEKNHGKPAQSAAEARGVKIAAKRAAAKGIDWKTCPEDWGVADPIKCGFVTVPVDYKKPNGKTIKIAVDRAESTGSKSERQGSLLYNPGGPGGSGLRFPTRVTTENPLWTKAAKAYDFVGFEPRGVGHSAPISCMDPQESVKAPKPDPVPDSEADKLAGRKRAKEYSEGCRERSGAMLPHMTTTNTARDLDVLRAALGDKKLNFIGVSYGTYLGGVYATLFPEHVRRLLLDSVVNPARDNIWYQANLNQNVAFQTRWEDWTKWVAKHDDTYGIGSSAQQVQKQWDKLRATVKKEPLGGQVGPEELLGFFQGAPYYDEMWAEVAKIWSAYIKGDEQPLIDAASPDMDDTAGNIASENGTAVYNAVECTDAKWPRSWKKWDRDSERLHKDYPFLTWSNTWMNLPCATWGKQYRPIEVGAKKLPSTLLVQSERDAATPYEGAVELHKRLKGSRLITEENAGSHGVTTWENSCINKRVDNYLLKGKVDKKDVTCAPHQTPTPEEGETASSKAKKGAPLPGLPTVR
ncbi:alpha/beta hydrolase [Streptomyces sp. NPDC005438]|uniref:alpha/beta hydrolase n=1 Tax=Streptomyces sp. NPDC005438 TaxID=3156880 RepID=UPI0033BBED8B